MYEYSILECRSEFRLEFYSPLLKRWITLATYPTLKEARDRKIYEEQKDKDRYVTLVSGRRAFHSG